jgi:phosphoglycerate dehydrogenase-like enzyme
VRAEPANRLRAVVAAPLSEENAERVRRAEPRVDLVYEPELLPPMRHPADFDGDPDFHRSDEQQARFEALIDTAEALYGIPDVDPCALARTAAANPRLRWVHTMAAGGGGQVKTAGLDEQQLNRIIFTTSAGVHGGPLAEWAVFGILAGAKNLDRLLQQQRAHNWPGRWEMRQLSQMTVLVLGLGGIGRQVVAKISALGGQVIGTSRRPDTLDPNVTDDVSRIIHPDRLAKTLGEVDVLVTTLPGTTQTEGMVGALQFATARPGLIVVNVGRGSVIDEAALVEALRTGQVGYAALDVFATEPLPDDSPLWDLPNVLVSPHTAALNTAEDARIADLFADNAGRLMDGRPMRNVVDIVEFY